MNQISRFCIHCKRDLPIDNFYGRKSVCKSCLIEYKKRTRKRAWALDTIRNHRKKGFEILITAEQLEEFAEETTTCKWCGRNLQWERFLGYSNAVPTLDRIDNEKCLSLDNIEIICHNCNSAKGQLNEQQFTSLIKRMYEVTVIGNKN